jgi:hypothetical protein
VGCFQTGEIISPVDFSCGLTTIRWQKAMTTKALLPLTLISVEH